jgi:Zn-dependent protease
MEQTRPSPPAERRGLRVGSVLGVPIYVSPTWLLIAGVIVYSYAPRVGQRLPHLTAAGAYATAAAFALLLFVSVLLHELGHAAAALRLGIGVKGMTLWMLGGYTEMEQEPRTPKGEFLVAAAGPAVSLLLGIAGLVATLALEPGGVTHELALQTMVCNLSVALFNVLPGLPLDGGSLVRAAVWRIGGNRNTGTVIAGWSGRVLAALILMFGVLSAIAGDSGLAFLGLLLTIGVGIFLWMGASHAVKSGSVADRLPGLHPRSLLRPCLTVPADLPLSEALRRAHEAGARGLIVVDGDGAATGVVAEHSVNAVPEERRPWIPVADVAKTLEPGMIIPADLTGEALLQAMQACPTTEYVVSDADRVVGVLVALDVAQTLDPKGSIR